MLDRRARGGYDGERPLRARHPRRIPSVKTPTRRATLPSHAPARTRGISLGACLAVLLLAGCLPQNPFRSRKKSPPVARVEVARLQSDVAWLSDDAREGRGTGTAGNDSTAAWLAARYRALGIGPGVPGYLQTFVARSVVTAHAGGNGGSGGLPTQNVVAMIPGSDPALRGQWVILGAHFDHLGRSVVGAADPQAGEAIRNGADDNASGTATVLELARMLRRRPLRRSVMFVHFSGEELGLLGSQHFVGNPPVPLDSVQAMLNFDMVGRLTNDKLLVYGVATAAELPAIVDSANARGTPPLRITAIGDGFGPSDHSSFFAKNVPVLHFFTNVHEDYHKATDDAPKINVEGMSRVIGLAWRTLREIGDREQRLTFKRGTTPPPVAGARQGTQVWLGSVPDMAASDVKGLRLSGVTPGSPADQAGLAEGDVIVEFDGKPVTDLYSYSEALYPKQPGDVVKVVVLRGAERKEFTVTLGRRGQRND